ncbi:MAG: CoA transferase [Deltaproteobacteria bacterium]|nr:CoA transferase [Deltaproteobacteria bacterium]
MKTGPLSGVRVLDLTWATGGPYGTLLLAFLGAEVIKIETPPDHKGVNTRQMLFPNFSHGGEDVHFLTYNRSKKSVVIDLRKEGGKAVFYDLVRQSDVVFDNFRPGVTKRLGIDYTALRGINPRIICCSVSGFGSSGPESRKPAFDTIIEAASGMTAQLLTMLPDGVRPPSYPGTSWADHVGGLAGAYGVVSALYERERTGEGREVDIAMQDMLISMLGYITTGEANFPDWRDPLPRMLWGSFETGDHPIVLCGHREGMWRNLTRALDREQWQEDPRFDSHERRIENGEELTAMIEEILKTKPSAEWIDILKRHDVPCTPIHTVREVIDGPQTRIRNMMPAVTHKGKTVKAPGNPVKISGVLETVLPPPALGEHTREILTEVLNYSSQKIAELLQDGSVA